MALHEIEYTQKRTYWYLTRYADLLSRACRSLDSDSLYYRLVRLEMSMILDVIGAISSPDLARRLRSGYRGRTQLSVAFFVRHRCARKVGVKHRVILGLDIIIARGGFGFGAGRRVWRDAWQASGRSHGDVCIVELGWWSRSSKHR